VLTGMLGSTLLTVAFVPSVFVILQRLEEWRDRRKAQRAKDTKATVAATIT
jgi:HAE1 family hydrophobic/amphiphilic exporter-1